MIQLNLRSFQWILRNFDYFLLYSSLDLSLSFILVIILYFQIK
jgi:hypothetical protein